MKKYTKYLLLTALLIIVLGYFKFYTQSTDKKVSMDISKRNSDSNQSLRSLIEPTSFSRPAQNAPQETISTSSLEKYNPLDRMKKSSPDLLDEKDIRPQFRRETYEKTAKEFYNKALSLFAKYKELEKTKGLVKKSNGPEFNHQKSLVEIHDEKGLLIARLAYLPNDYLSEIAEMKGDSVQDGLTISYSSNGKPYRIFTWKENKLNGLCLGFTESGELIEYGEFKNMAILGLRLAWTKEGFPLKICAIITEPIPYP